MPELGEHAVYDAPAPRVVERSSERECVYCSLALICVAAWVVLITAGLIVIARRVAAIRGAIIARVVVVRIAVSRVVVSRVIVVSGIRSVVITLDRSVVVARIVSIAGIIVAVRVRRAVET